MIFLLIAHTRWGLVESYNFVQMFSFSIGYLSLKQPVHWFFAFNLTINILTCTYCTHILAYIVVYIWQQIHLLNAHRQYNNAISQPEKRAKFIFVISEWSRNKVTQTTHKIGLLKKNSTSERINKATTTPSYIECHATEQKQQQQQLQQEWKRKE